MPNSIIMQQTRTYWAQPHNFLLFGRLGISLLMRKPLRRSISTWISFLILCLGVFVASVKWLMIQNICTLAFYYLLPTIYFLLLASSQAQLRHVSHIPEWTSNKICSISKLIINASQYLTLLQTTQNFEHQTPNFQLRTHNFELRTLNF